MFNHLRGLLVEKQPPMLVIDVQGIGYEVEAPLSTFYHLPPLKEEVMLFVHFSVREDAQVLYGFSTDEERQLFRHLIRINSVGPKLALSILSSMELTTFIECIQENNIARLMRIPGVGKKTAERLGIEMRDRLKTWHIDKPAHLEPASHAQLTQGLISPKEDAISALIALGYKPKDATDWVNNIAAPDLTSEEMIRRALQKAI